MTELALKQLIRPRLATAINQTKVVRRSGVYTSYLGNNCVLPENLL